MKSKEGFYASVEDFNTLEEDFNASEGVQLHRRRVL